MADQTVPTSPAIIPTESGYPPLSVPTLLADGVAAIAQSPQVVKFSLYRTDPDMSGAPSYKNQVFLQIAMPTDNFAQTCILFERALKNLIATNVYSQEKANAVNAAFDALTRAQK